MSGHLLRGLAYFAMVTTLVILSIGPVFSMHSTGGDLLPDLVTLQPRDFSIELAEGEKRLRFRNEVGNQHTGPLEAEPQRVPVGQDTDDCDGDGIANNDRRVFQRVYQDQDSDGVFTRHIDTEARSIEAGCMEFHEEHNHWHFNDFALYELKPLRGQGRTLAVSPKVSFCFVDFSHPFPNLPGSPNGPFYKPCSQSTRQGISIGWSDVYRASVPGQYIIITDVRDGDYCVVSTADPSNRLLETIEDNNSRSLKINLTGNTVTEFPNEPC